MLRERLRRLVDVDELLKGLDPELRSPTEAPGKVIKGALPGVVEQIE